MTANLLQYIHFAGFQTLAVRCALLYGIHWSPERSVYLGGTTGLRGFGPYDFTGQRTALLNVEDRIATPHQLWFFKLGAVVFYDCGSAWDEHVATARVRLHSSAGIGLRIENEKQQGSGIIRIDFAYNLSASQWGQVIISTDQAFSPVKLLDLVSPSLTF